MYARLAKAWDRMVDKVLDVLWDVTLPLSSRCPVCAFWRGVLFGAVLWSLVALWTVQ
jgi:hypothetical protein